MSTTAYNEHKRFRAFVEKLVGNVKYSLKGIKKGKYVVKVFGKHLGAEISSKNGIKQLKQVIYYKPMSPHNKLVKFLGAILDAISSY